MCNRYRPASVVRIRDCFGFTYIESGGEALPDYRTGGIGPLQPGPFIRAGGRLQVGQWGLTPDKSKTLRPLRADGRPMFTNNARWDETRQRPEKWTFQGAWARDQRCLIPAEDFDEPCYPEQTDAGDGRCTWWRFRRADGAPWAIAGLCNEWTDPETGEVRGSYTMLTVNCDSHPLLQRMHKPERGPDRRILPPDQQDKRTVVPLEPAAWDAWLHGSLEQAAGLVRLSAPEIYDAGPVEARQQG